MSLFSKLTRNTVRRQSNEVTMPDGMNAVVIEDDGAGWVKVQYTAEGWDWLTMWIETARVKTVEVA